MPVFQFYRLAGSLTFMLESFLAALLGFSSERSVRELIALPGDYAKVSHKMPNSLKIIAVQSHG